MAEGTRFENAEDLETIGCNTHLSVSTQSLTDPSEDDETPIKPRRARSFCQSLATATPEKAWVKNSQSGPLVRPRLYWDICIFFPPFKNKKILASAIT